MKALFSKAFIIFLLKSLFHKGHVLNICIGAFFHQNENAVFIVASTRIYVLKKVFCFIMSSI